MERWDRHRGEGGFTLLEATLALGILAVAGLALTSAVASQSRLNATARERIIAINAIRAYVEHMRQQYPAAGSTNMTGFLDDKTTPRDFLPTSGIEVSAVRDPRGLVLKMTDETGWAWGPGAGAAPTNWPWSDATMSAIGPIDTKVTTRPTPSELCSLGFVNPNTAHVGADLDGDGGDTTRQVAPDHQLVVPCQITLSWLSGSGSAASRKRISIYATFGPQH